MTSCGTPTETQPSRPLRAWPPAGGLGLDLTGLALMRILTATWLLIDLKQRVTGLGFLQTDGGAFSRATLIADQAQSGTSLGNWSLHLITGSPELQYVFAVIATLAHLTLLVGWRTRMSALVSVILVVSLAHRTPLAALPLDPFLALLAWWCVALPCGARLSLDAARRGPGGPPVRIGSMPGILFAMTLGGLAVALFRESPLLCMWPVIVLVLVSIPHRWWRCIPAAWKRPAVTIWIDGECGICTRAGRLLTQIHGGDLTLRLIQEDPEVHALSDAHTSWVVDTGGQRLLGWRAVRAMFSRSPWLWPFSVPLPWLGEKIYTSIATNRHRPWWGWMGPIPAEEPLRPVVWWLIVAFAVACCVWEPATRVGGLVCTTVPGPGLMTAPATLANGTQADLRTGGGAMLVEPIPQLPSVYTSFSSPRTRAHLSRLATHPLAARAYLDHLVRLATARGGTVSHAELRQLNLETNGWRSTTIATTP